MCAKFYNPYHFVPVDPQGSTNDLGVDRFERGESGHVTHDRYLTDAREYFSGRLVCRLTTEDPVVVGNKHEQPNLQDCTIVHPFEFVKGEPAIPATGLKGLISSVAEAASNSALRVLEDKPLSYRVSARGDGPRGSEPLSAIGMVVAVPQPDGKTLWRLRPLALPTMEINDGRAVLPAEYREMFPLDQPPPLKVYVGNKAEISDPAFVGGLPLRSYCLEHPDYCYAQLRQRTWGLGHTLAKGDFQHFSEKGGHLLAQDTVDRCCPITEAEFQLPGHDPSQYTRGILRVLGVPGRRDIPGNKEHELFIPYTRTDEQRDTFPIPKEVVDRFHDMADQRTEAGDDDHRWPYEPRGTQRNLHPEKPDDHRFRLKDGDLVYFRPRSGRAGVEIEEIALSSIWRRWAGNVHEHFRRISGEKLPFNPDRRKISLAEQLFGFADTTRKVARGATDRDNLALAGRVRFSVAALAPGQKQPYYLPPAPLKILSSPKPPQPAFYYTGGSERVSPGDLYGNQRLIPQGRKFYLHRSAQQGFPWKTDHPDDELTKKQKSLVTPLRKGLTFCFHIDFDNLSRLELGLLCYALRPTQSFRHKLGMGKPIGLGKVFIEPVGLFLVDRHKRYQQTDLFEWYEDEGFRQWARYHQAWVASDPGQWPAAYAREWEARKVGQTPLTFDGFRELFAGKMQPDIKKALKLLGDPSSTNRYPVHTPQKADADVETETYAWFVENQNPAVRQQRLEPITAGTALPPLEDSWTAVPQRHP